MAITVHAEPTPAKAQRKHCFVDAYYVDAYQKDEEPDLRTADAKPAVRRGEESLVRRDPLEQQLSVL